jgi:hypothetical protein
MANPLPDEDKIYEALEKEKIALDPRIWELMNHHIRNDLNKVSVGVGTLALTPEWILKAASFLIKFLYKMSLQPGPPPDEISKICHLSLRGVDDINIFLKKLRTLKRED